MDQAKKAKQAADKKKKELEAQKSIDNDYNNRKYKYTDIRYAVILTMVVNCVIHILILVQRVEILEI